MSASGEPFATLADDYAAGGFDYDDAVCAWIASRTPRPRVALDVGAGPGLLATPLRRHVGRVVAVDPIRSMARHAGGRGDDSIACGDAVVACGERLPIRRDVVDLVVCSQSLHWMDAAAFVTEARRVVVADTGRLVVTWRTQPDESPEGRLRERLVGRFGQAPVPAGRRTDMGTAWRDVGFPARLREARRFVERRRATPERLVRLALSRVATWHLQASERQAARHDFVADVRDAFGTVVEWDVDVEVRVFDFDV